MSKLSLFTTTNNLLLWWLIISIITMNGQITAQLFQDEFPSFSIFHNLLKLSHGTYSVNSLEDAYSNPNITSVMTPLDYVKNCKSAEVLIGTGINEEDDDVIVIVFSGTKGIIDHLVNANQLAITYYGPKGKKVKEAGMVHVGQNRAVFENNLFDKITSTVSELLVPSDNDNENTSLFAHIYLTGHSQGGAYASLLGPVLAKMFPQINMTVVTYGQPRMAKTAFKDYARRCFDNLAIWRLVLRSDTVPRTPKTLRGYVHAGHLIQLEDGDDTTTGALAYFEQTGNETLGYLGVNEEWNDEFSPLIENHVSEAYVEYFESIVLNNESVFFPTAFETLSAYK